MKKYILTSTSFKGEITLEFNVKGRRKYYCVNAELNDAQELWLNKNEIRKEADLEKYKSFKVRVVFPDLTFKAFWNAYAYKVGNKKKAEKLYNALTETERQLILEHIPRYKYYLQTSGVAQVYPERFLLQKRWENELPQLKTRYGQ